ncbi:MAG TPA: hypothetical protein VFC01_30665 [Mycobacterium sp.]|nr:hypothetical protein [Mycobacterium sp.]
MDETRLSRQFLRVFLVFLILTALLAISIVLFEDRNQTRWRILGTSSVISVASVAAMACAAFRERGQLRWLGNVGMSLCFAAAAGIVVAIWDFVHDETYGRFLGCLSTVAGFTALGQLLWLMPLIQPHRWVQKATTYTIAVLTMLICLQIAARITDAAWDRLWVAIAIVVTLQVLAHPILWQLGRRAGGAAQRRLLLSHERDDIWTDGAGRRYSVRPLLGDMAAGDLAGDQG